MNQKKDSLQEKKKILFIGNCQTCISQFLQTVPSFQTNYDIQLVEVYKPIPTTHENININNFDVVVTQPILDSFDKYPQYQTKNIIHTIERTDIKFIMFPVCYYDFNFPFLESENGMYVEKNIEKIYNSGLSQFAYFDMVNDPTLLDYSIITYRLNKSNTTLEDRETYAYESFKRMCENKGIIDFHFIFVSDFIRENFRKNLFYTFNHPNKLLLSFLAYKILVCLNLFDPTYSNTVSDYLVFPKKLDPLNAFICPIYKCFQPFFEINIDEYNKNLSYKGAKPCNVTKFFRYYVSGHIGNSNLKKIKKTENNHLLNKNILYNMMNSTIKKCVTPKKKTTSTISGKSTLLKMTSNIDMNSSSGFSHVGQNQEKPPRISGEITTDEADGTNGIPNKKNFNANKKKLLPGKLLKQKNCNSNF